VKVAQQLLSHSSVTTTIDTNSHMVPGLKEKAAAKINDIFNEKEKSPSISIIEVLL